MPKETETGQTSEAMRGDIPVQNLTPTEKAQKKHYEKEAVKNESKAKLFDTLRTCSKVLSVVIGVVLTLGGIYLAYYISSVAEPIGSHVNCESQVQFSICQKEEVQ